MLQPVFVIRLSGANSFALKQVEQLRAPFRPFSRV